MSLLSQLYRRTAVELRLSRLWSASQTKLRLVSVLLGCCLLMSGPLAADDEFPAIRAAVFEYFEGINEVSRERLLRAFDANAALKSVDASGTLVLEPIAKAIDRWMRGDPQQRQGTILSIEISGGTIARVVFDFDGAYTDFLTLAKLGGQWKIIDKVFVPMKTAPAGTAQ